MTRISAKSDTPTIIAEFKSSYPLLLGAIAGSAIGLAGTIVYSMPFFLQPLQDSFGWDRKEVAGAATCHTIGLLIGSPLFGWLCDRYGVTRLALISSIGYAIILALMGAFVGSLPTLYAGYVLASLVGAGTTYVAYSRLVSFSFDKGRGLALGLTMSGAGMMAVIIPLALPPIIEAYGWRWGYLAIAAIVLLTVPLCLTVLPSNAEVRSTQRSAEHAGLSLGQAMATRQFWSMWVGILTLSVTIVGSHLFLVQIIQEAGTPQAEAAAMVSLFGTGIVVGRICTGFLMDRFHGAYVAAGNFVTPAVGMLGLVYFGAPAAPYYLFALGLAAGAEGDVIGYLASRYFGLRSYSEIFGWLFTALVLGVASGPLVVGWCREAIGSFTPLLYVGAANCSAVAILFMTMGQYRNFEDGSGDLNPAPEANAITYVNLHSD